MNKFGKLSIISASLLLPLTFLISGFVAWQLKESNPNNVDITSSMAYLKQILGTTLVVGAVVWVFSLAMALMGIKKDASSELGKLGLLALVLVTVFSIAGGMVNNAAGDAEEAYRDKKASEFFQKLEEN